jgi:ribosomal protein S18 acetylase RimI-like enzyme
MTASIQPLLTLSEAALARLIVGYVSNEKYIISKTETPLRTVIALERVALDRPYEKRWGPPDPELARRYAGLPALGFSFGAYAGEELIGLALAEPHAWNRTLWIWEFHVAAGQRRGGVGRRLMEAVAEKARAAGLRVMVCEAQNTNVPAIDFYRAVGFALEAVDLSYYSNDDLGPEGEVAIFMKRRLSQSGYSLTTAAGSTA